MDLGNRAPSCFGSVDVGGCEGYLTHAVLGAHMWAKWLHNPYCLGGPQGKAEIKMAI